MQYELNTRNFVPALLLFRYAFWILLAPAPWKQSGDFTLSELRKLVFFFAL